MGYQPELPFMGRYQEVPVTDPGVELSPWVRQWLTEEFGEQPITVVRYLPRQHGKSRALAEDA